MCDCWHVNTFVGGPTVDVSACVVMEISLYDRCLLGLTVASSHFYIVVC